MKVWPGEVSGTRMQDTLETSLCAHHLLPTDDGPAHGYPIPLAGKYLQLVISASKIQSTEF